MIYTKRRKKGIIRKMEKNRRRVIKEDRNKDQPDVQPEIEKVEEAEPVNTELFAAIAYKLNESTILIRNILAKPDSGHSEMEMAAFVDALAAFEIAGENPKRFIEARAQYFAKTETEEEVEE